MGFSALSNAVAPAYGDQPRQRISIPVPAVTLYPGDELHRGNLGEREYAASSQPPAFHTDTESIVGKVARRTLLAGQPIPLDAVRFPFAIVLGQSVLVSYEAGAVRITGPGEAMASGGVGDLISVRVPDTGAIVKGRVIDERTVAIEVP